MAEDYFPAGDPQSQAGSTLEGPGGPPEEGKGDGEGKADENESGETALIPKSMLGSDIQPGQTITVKVKRVFEEEVEVEPVGSEESGKVEESEGDMNASMGQLDRMSKAA